MRQIRPYAGPGAISYVWLASDAARYSSLILRWYWESDPEPSVEAPVGQFFAIGHDEAPHEVLSIPIVVGPSRGCASHWPMPFRRHAKLTLENTSDQDATVIAFKVLYRLHDVGDDAAYFHARYSASIPSLERPEHTILDNVQGRGLYVGTSIAFGMDAKIFAPGQVTGERSFNAPYVGYPLAGATVMADAAKSRRLTACGDVNCDLN